MKFSSFLKGGTESLVTFVGGNSSFFMNLTAIPGASPGGKKCYFPNTDNEHQIRRCFTTCYLISMRAGLVALQFDWLRAGLSMDLPVFVYEDWLKTSFKTVKMFRPAFNMVYRLSTSNHQDRAL